MDKAQHIYAKLINDFGFKGSIGEIIFTLKDISLVVSQNNVVGNILEEWLDKRTTYHTSITKASLVPTSG